MNILTTLSLGLWIVLCSETTGARYPHNLSITGEDFKFTLKWKIAEVSKDTVTKNKTEEIEDEKSSKIYRRAANETFTVFQWGTNITGEYEDDVFGIATRGYLEQPLPVLGLVNQETLIFKPYVPTLISQSFIVHEVWTKVKGCYRVSGNECIVDELLAYDEEFTFWVTDSTTDTNVAIKDIALDQILDYMPGGEMTFSSPKFSASRKKNKLFIEFHPKRMDHWGLNETIPEYLKNRLFEPIYTIYYYKDQQKKNVTLIKNQGPIESLRNYKVVPADVSNVTITSSIPSWSRLCISVRFIDDEITKEFKTSFSTKCLSPEAPPAGNGENHLVSDRTNMIWLYVLFGVASFVFIVIAVQCCRKGPKTIKKIFSIQPIHIPEVTNYIIKEEPKSNARLIFSGVPDVDEVIDVIKPLHKNDDVFHFRSRSPSNTEPKQKRLSSDSGNLSSKTRQRYETGSRNKETNLLDIQKISSCSPDAPISSPKESAEDYLDMSVSPSSKVIVFEHLLGPYVADCIWDTNDEIEVVSASDTKIQKKDSMLDQTSICSENKASQIKSRGRVPKQRFLSEDSAFYDDFPPSTFNGKEDACYD